MIDRTPSFGRVFLLTVFVWQAGGCAANATFDPGTATDNETAAGGATGGGGAPGGTATGHGGAGGANEGGSATIGGLFDGIGDPVSGQGSAGAGAGCGTPVLSGVIRDFRAYEDGKGHPDFQVYTGDGLKGIVADTLDADHKPVYALPGPSEMTAGKDAFDQWYRDVEGVNLPMPLDLIPEVDESGLATFADPSFFPIDDQGFGNQLFYHNYHFTFELHMTFVYAGGEHFSFGGDDDVWVFVNGKLAIDLGGVHMAQIDEIDLDARAEELGLEVGEEYPLDFFMAERHTTESKFQLQTTLKFTNCDPILY